MAKSKATADEPEDGAQAVPETTPIEIVDLDQAIAAEALTPEEVQQGQSFWFGEVGLFKFADGTSYHAKRNRDFITDPKLIENLKTAAANPTSKIIPE